MKIHSGNERRVFLAHIIEILCSFKCNYMSKDESIVIHAHVIGISCNFKVE